jgi:hypothetical protein
MLNSVAAPPRHSMDVGSIRNKHQPETKLFVKEEKDI